MAEFRYTQDELDHLQDLRLGIFLCGGYEMSNDAVCLRAEAARLREHGPWADAENGPSEWDPLEPTAADFDEEADEIECDMWRGEHL